VLLSVACKGGTQASSASVPLFSYQVALWSKGHAYAGSLHEAVCRQLQVLYEVVFNSRVVIRQLQP
jgi:hypothetical protein